MAVSFKLSSVWSYFSCKIAQTIRQNSSICPVIKRHFIATRSQERLPTNPPLIPSVFVQASVARCQRNFLLIGLFALPIVFSGILLAHTSCPIFRLKLDRLGVFHLPKTFGNFHEKIHRVKNVFHFPQVPFAYALVTKIQDRGTDMAVDSLELVIIGKKKTIQCTTTTTTTTTTTK